MVQHASAIFITPRRIRRAAKGSHAKSLPAMSFRTLDRFRMFQIRVLPASLSGTLSLYSKKTHMRSGQAFTSSRRLPRAWLCGYVLCSVRESLPCCSLPWKALAEAWRNLGTTKRDAREWVMPRLTHFCSMGFSNLVAWCWKVLPKMSTRVPKSQNESSTLAAKPAKDA